MECIYEQKIIVKVLYVEYSHVMCSIILCVKNSKQLLGCEVPKVLNIKIIIFVSIYIVCIHTYIHILYIHTYTNIYIQYMHTHY